MSSDDATDPTDGEDQSRREKAVEGFDAGIVDLLSWVLDTETRAKIYIYLQANPGSTSEEIAQGTGLYPSTVREALAELHDEETVEREKRESEGAGNNPYEYTAIAPSDLVSGVVGQVQDELNTVFNLDSVLQRADDDEFDDDHEDEPVTITVSAEDSAGDAAADDTGGTGEDGDLEDATADDE
jgi:predicted transcriptional regulator